MKDIESMEDLEKMSFEEIRAWNRERDVSYRPFVDRNNKVIAPEKESKLEEAIILYKENIKTNSAGIIPIGDLW